jgi:hypothetical protein
MYSSAPWKRVHNKDARRPRPPRGLHRRRRWIRFCLSNAIEGEAAVSALLALLPRPFEPGSLATDPEWRAALRRIIGRGDPG